MERGHFYYLPIADQAELVCMTDVRRKPTDYKHGPNSGPGRLVGRAD